MNLQKLKGYLVEKGYTYEQSAKIIGISVTAFNQKINGKRRFYLEELNLLADTINMPKEDRIRIFLN